MTKTTFTEFRKRAKTYLDSVERGETVQILRHGKPIANITPIDEDPNDKPWKKPRVKLVIPGISASRLIIHKTGPRPDSANLASSKRANWDGVRSLR